MAIMIYGKLMTATASASVGIGDNQQSSSNDNETVTFDIAQNAIFDQIMKLPAVNFPKN